MTDTKDLTDKQKLFEKRFERSGQYLSDEADKEICNILDSVQITKKEIVDLLDCSSFRSKIYWQRGSFIRSLILFTFSYLSI